MVRDRVPEAAKLAEEAGAAVVHREHRRTAVEMHIDSVRRLAHALRQMTRPDGVCEAADVVDRHCYRGPDMPPANGRRVSFLGEFGGLGQSVEGHSWQTFSQAAMLRNKRDDWGYGGMDDTKTREGLEAAYLGLMEKLGALAVKGLSGSVYTQTTDMDFEVNGLLTYDRRVLKFNPAVLKAAHERVIALALAAMENP